MRKILLSLFLSFFVLTLFGQQDSLLRNFKFRNINYRAITMNVGAGSQFYRTSFLAGKNESHSSSGSGAVTYYNLKSTDRILFEMTGSLNTGFGFGKSSNTSDEYKNHGLSFAPSLNLLNKWFSGNFFIEMGANVSINYTDSKNTYTTASSVHENESVGQSAAITAGIGKGRLENITDMQNALWLNKALEKEGRLSRSLSAGELNGLGRAVTKANNTRVLDARRRTQYILETIDDYFQQRELISKTDIKYFSNLNDIAFFALNDPRLSGTEMFIRLTPSISNGREESTQKPPMFENKTKSTNKSVHASVGLNEYIPLSLQHQNNFGFALKLDYFSHHYNQKYFTSGVLTSETDTKPDLRQASLTAFFEHAIYPNTRTLVSIKLDSETGYQDVEGNYSFFGKATLAGSLNYFISHRTRLNCTLGGFYLNNVHADDNYLTLLPRTLQFFANAELQVSL